MNLRQSNYFNDSNGKKYGNTTNIIQSKQILIAELKIGLINNRKKSQMLFQSDIPYDVVSVK